MPELPDITVYCEALSARVEGRILRRVRISGPALLRSVAPPVDEAVGRRVRGVRRIGKRIVIELDGGLYLVLHLMIAGRLHWKKAGAAVPRKRGLAAFDFDDGTLLLTEASPKKRASLHVVSGDADLAKHDPGGLEVEGSTLADFERRIRSANHTLKRALTDPRLFSGIGNAYSDEILHRARLSPVALTSKLTGEAVARLRDAARETLSVWTRRLREESADRFPDNVTAFREGMAVHGRHREPCPDCGAPVQRIVYASNETNYCATCQTGGRLLADRALSQLLKRDWPRSLEDLEARRPGPALPRADGRRR